MDTPVKLKPSAFNAQVRHNGKVLAFISLIAFSLEMSEPQARVFNETLDEIARVGWCENASEMRAPGDTSQEDERGNESEADVNGPCGSTK